jgi:hypothetical protein
VSEFAIPTGSTTTNASAPRSHGATVADVSAPRGSWNRGTLVTLAVYAAVFGMMTWWSWRRWPDPLVDFGRELYVPWQITRGRMLYRDLLSLFGPLSPYVNALWFRLFGVSLLTLALCNLAIFAAVLAGVHRILAIAADRVTATAAGITVLLLCGFSQYVPVGNYNFVTPYAHEAAHGLALSVAMILLLHRAVRDDARWAWTLAGFCFGLVLLTKPEIGLAAAGAAATAWIAALVLGGRGRAGSVVRAALFIAGAAVAPLCFFIYLAAHMPAIDAARATAGAWVPVFGTGISANEFYRRSMGLTHPLANVFAIVVSFAGVVLFILAAAIVAWRSADARVARSVGSRVLRIGVLAAAIFAARGGTVPRALPILVLAAVVLLAVLFAERRGRRDDAVRLVPLIVWSVFALLLMAKMGLNPRVVHYGFYLGFPAATVSIALVGWLIPEWLGRRRGPAASRAFQMLALWAVAASIAPYLGLAYGWYRTKTIAIGTGGDRFYASSLGWQGTAVRDALGTLGALPAGQTLAVMPEGVMINYLSRRDSPLRVVNLMPPELMAFGEDEILRSLRASPPDVVMLIDKDTSEYGYPKFGSDERYGSRVVAWVAAGYDKVQSIQPAGAGDARGGIQIWKRRSR